MVGTDESKKLARNLLKLPQEKLLVLFSAIQSTSDPRKRFRFIIPALQKLNELGGECFDSSGRLKSLWSRNHRKCHQAVGKETGQTNHVEKLNDAFRQPILD